MICARQFPSSWTGAAPRRGKPECDRDPDLKTESGEASIGRIAALVRKKRASASLGSWSDFSGSGSIRLSTLACSLGKRC